MDRRANVLVTAVIVSEGSDTKFDYGNQVPVISGKCKDRLGDVVGVTVTVSLQTYTVEFGDESDAEIEERLLSKVDK